MRLEGITVAHSIRHASQTLVILYLYGLEPYEKMRTRLRSLVDGVSMINFIFLFTSTLNVKNSKAITGAKITELNNRNQQTQPSILVRTSLCKWVAEVRQVVGEVCSAARDIECVLIAGSRLLKQKR